MYLDQELRAKYSDADREKMAKSGSAMPDGSYPIADLADLKNAIRAVGRGGSSHNAIRKHIIARAKALGHSDLIPDNWNSDGSLDESASAWETDEQRQTYSDLICGVEGALSEDYGNTWCFWINDLDADARVVYYTCNGALYARPFTAEPDGPIVLDEPKRVRPVTTYVPTEENAAKAPAEHRRATKTLEWRRQCAEVISEMQRKRPATRQVTQKIEVRSDDEDGPIVLRSYASLFNTPYPIRGGSYSYEETVDPGSFTRTLKNGPDVVFRTEHGSLPLARTTSSTLRLGEDDRGLWYEADLDRSDPDVMALIPKIRRGDLTESSFAFRCLRDSWSEDRSRRRMQECDLHRGDVSIVTFGASPATGSHLSLRFEEQLSALRAIGADAFIEAWVEWRNWTLIPIEQRIGKSISNNNFEVLQQVMGLVAGADDNVDEALVMLSDLMDVPNPNAEAVEDNSNAIEENAADPAVPVEDPEVLAEADPDPAEPDPADLIPSARYDEFEAELRGLGL